eukprot:7676319-Alexandrium_andersonii.AAC.1
MAPLTCTTQQLKLRELRCKGAPALSRHARACERHLPAHVPMHVHGYGLHGRVLRMRVCVCVRVCAR